MHAINAVFGDAVFCLNLDRRTDRRQQAEHELSTYGIKAEFISAVDGKDLQDPKVKSEDSLPMTREALGCTLSHLKMIKLAKERNYPAVMIFEDDVVFTPSISSTFESYYTLLDPDWDMFYLGGNNHGGLKMVNEKIARIKRTYATHAYAVKSTVYDEIIQALSKVEKADVSLSLLHSKLNCYVCRPHLAFQREGFSDILQREVNYSFLRD